MLGRYLLKTSRIYNPDLSEPTQTELTTLSFDDSSQTCLEHIMERPHSSLRYINLWIPRLSTVKNLSCTEASAILATFAMVSYPKTS